MKTIKKFWRYFLNFVILIILVYALNWLGLTNFKPFDNTREIECITDVKNATVDNVICTNKKIEGTITNDSTKLINNFYIKADFFNSNQELLGTEHYNIKYFNVREKVKFVFEHSYSNVATVKISVADTMV